MTTNNNNTFINMTTNNNNTFIKPCSFCGQAIEMSDKNGRWQAFEESGDYHNCLRNRNRRKSN
ncbi:MAG TPA: hypothetical protein VIP29_01655 [Nitrososphaeraceae archaeon]